MYDKNKEIQVQYNLFVYREHLFYAAGVLNWRIDEQIYAAKHR